MIIYLFVLPYSHRVLPYFYLFIYLILFIFLNKNIKFNNYIFGQSHHMITYNLLTMKHSYEGPQGSS